MLRLENITGGYTSDRNILQDVTLHIAKGEAVGIIGLNGSGKSTLGKAIMNMLPRRSGKIYFDGQDISGKKTHEFEKLGIAYMGQGAPVFDQLSVWENLELAAGNCRQTVENALAPLKSSIVLLDASRSALQAKRADKLSGGQRHQLALAMTLFGKPKMLILDEPSAGLDPAAAGALYQILARIRRQTDVTIFLIEQNVHLAGEFCRRMFVMRHGCPEENLVAGGVPADERVEACAA